MPDHVWNQHDCVVTVGQSAGIAMPIRSQPLRDTSCVSDLVVALVKKPSNPALQPCNYCQAMSLQHDAGHTRLCFNLHTCSQHK